MAKPTPSKNQPKPEAAIENAVPQPAKTPAENPVAQQPVAQQPVVAEPVAKPMVNPPATSNAKKDPAVNRSKKGPTGSAKGSAWMPSQHKLENLKAAVAAAGSVDNLLLILQHVDEAGGRQEVAESVEAYRALKLALE